MLRKKAQCLIRMKNKVIALFAENSPAAHDIGHISRVVKWTRIIARSEYPQDEEIRFLSRMAGWPHDTGRTVSDENHWDYSGDILLDWFKEDSFLSSLSVQHKERILYAVVNHWNDEANDFPEAIILRDADKLDSFGEIGVKRLVEYHHGNEEKIMRGLRLHYQMKADLKTKTARSIMEQGNLFGPIKELQRNLLSSRIKKLKLT